MALPARLLRPRADSRAEFPHNPRNIVLVFDTSKEPANLTVSVPIQGFAPNCVIDWGDGTSETHTTTGFKTHTYASAGVYIVQISGTMRTLSFGNTASTTNNKAKLVRCLSFGETGLTSLSDGLRACPNLIQAPQSLPRESNVTTLAGCFNSCTAFNDARIGGWNTSTVTSMGGMFNGASLFNQPIASWNVSSVTSMTFMFSRSSFNQNISEWNVSSCTDMSAMFNENQFSQDISTWNVSSVATFADAFRFNTAFSVDISSWDIRKAVNLGFNLSGSVWGTANYDAALEAWADLADDDLKSQAITAFAAQGGNTRVTSNGHGMVAGSRVNISGTTNYNGDYNVVAAAANTFDIGIAFVANDATGTMKHRRSRNVNLSVGSNKYSTGGPTTARGILTGTYLWSITDGGQL